MEEKERRPSKQKGQNINKGIEVNEEEIPASRK